MDSVTDNASETLSGGYILVTFSWLHLTDLHCGGLEYGWFWPRVEEQFLDDLAQLHDESGPWDFLFFTGDLVQRGSEAQFKQVSLLLDRILSRVKELGSTPRLLAVPGNHDLERPPSSDAGLSALRNWSEDRNLQQEFWADPSSACRQTVARALGNYTGWLNNYAPFARPDLTWGTLPGDFSFSLEKQGAKLGVLGLNTTALQLAEGDHKGRLALHPSQFHYACPEQNGPKWAREHDACLLLTHQPPDWLDAAGLEHLRAEIAVPGQFAVHLFGHMHEASYISLREGGSAERLFWQGRSLFGLDTYTDGSVLRNRLHGYSAGRLSIGDESSATVTFWPREARRGQDGAYHMVPDTSYSLPDGKSTAPQRVELLRKKPRTRPEATYNQPPTAVVADLPLDYRVKAKIKNVDVEEDIDVCGLDEAGPASGNSQRLRGEVRANISRTKAKNISIVGSRSGGGNSGPVRAESEE